MKILLEVFADLWNFATFGLFKKRKTSEKVFTPIPSKSPTSSDENSSDKRPTKPTNPPSKLVPFVKNDLVDLRMTPVNTDGCICVEQARLFIRPVWTFDGAFKILPYGAKIQIIRYEGRFAQICVNYIVGWVLKDEITTELSDVYPNFDHETVYDYDHSETKKLRKLSKDEFFAIELRLPLQDVEFVSYRLGQDGRSILWSNERPRLAGKWQSLLKGNVGVYIGIEPRTGSVMEYQKNGGGHVGYVKEVHVDDSIVLQTVGKEVSGMYTEEVLLKTKWQEHRPVFIQFN